MYFEILTDLFIIYFYITVAIISIMLVNIGI